MAILGMVAPDEVLQIGVAHRFGLEREVLVGAQVIDPQIFGPGFFASGSVVEEQYVGFHPLGVENTGW